MKFENTVPFATVADGVSWLYSQRIKTVNHNLDKLYYALEWLGNPHQGLPVIHVTGTNGKGSTVAFLRDILMSQGLNVATFTSPHIERFNERYQLNGQLIEDAELVGYLSQLWQLNEHLKTTDFQELTAYEIIMLVMPLFCARQQPDVVIIEVFIGGLLDYTNVFDAQLAVITTIDYDHQDRLGNTLEEIAYQKAGIIKNDAHVVVGDVPSHTLPIIETRVNDTHATLYTWNKQYGAQHLDTKLGESQFDFWSELLLTSYNVNITMSGEHQIHNATVALQSAFVWCQKIQKQEFNWDTALQAMQTTRWIARFEHIISQPNIILDGAHNMAGIQALESMTQQFFDKEDVIILYAGLTTKNQVAHLESLMKLTSAPIYVTDFPHPDVMTESYLIQLQKEQNELSDDNCVWVHNWRKWLEEYRMNPAMESKYLILTGSLYFLSHVRGYVMSHWN